MSLNLGNTGCDAARALNPSPEWTKLRGALRTTAQAYANKALDAPPEKAVSASAYACALRDVYMALEAATTASPISQVKPPGVVKEP